MKHKDLKAMKQEDLRRKLNESRGKLVELRFGAVNRQVKNVREIRTLRQTIARIETLLRAGANAQDQGNA